MNDSRNEKHTRGTDQCIARSELRRLELGVGPDRLPSGNDVVQLMSRFELELLTVT